MSAEEQTQKKQSIEELESKYPGLFQSESNAFQRIDIQEIVEAATLEIALETLRRKPVIESLTPEQLKELTNLAPVYAQDIASGYEGWNIHLDPTNMFSIGRDIKQDNNAGLTRSLRLGFGGDKGISPEIYLRTEHDTFTLSPEGDMMKEHTNTFMDAGYFHAEIGNPGETGSLHSNPFSGIQDNAEFCGARLFHQYFTQDDQQLYSIFAAGLTPESAAFIQGTAAYKAQTEQWDLTAAVQATLHNDEPRLDTKLSAERYFEIPAISAKFNAVVQNTLEPSGHQLTGYTQLDLRPENWENGENWFEREISATFNAQATLGETGSFNQDLSAGVCADIPFGRACIQQEQDGATALLYKHSF
ncbi:MAG: hypothetical protein ACLFP8_04255 [Alphaproteobacteria bacterium]